MKNKQIISLKILVVLMCLLSIFNLEFSCSRINNDRLFLGVDKAKEIINKAISDTTDVLYKGKVKGKVLIEHKETAIKLAEVLLFEIYGEKKIKRERPYEVHYIGHYWFIRGTLPIESDGGTFQVIIDSKNGEIVRLLHRR